MASNTEIISTFPSAPGFPLDHLTMIDPSLSTSLKRVKVNVDYTYDENESTPTGVKLLGVPMSDDDNPSDLGVSEFYMKDINSDNIYKITLVNDDGNYSIAPTIIPNASFEDLNSFFPVYSNIYFYPKKSDGSADLSTLVTIEINEGSLQLNTATTFNASLTIETNTDPTPQDLDWYPSIAAYPLTLSVSSSQNVDPSIFVFQRTGSGLDPNQGDIFVKIAKYLDFFEIGDINSENSLSNFYRQSFLQLAMYSAEEVYDLKQNIINDIEIMLKNWVSVNIAHFNHTDVAPKVAVNTNIQSDGTIIISASARI